MPRLRFVRSPVAPFGRRRLDQITVDDVAAYIAAMGRKGLRGSTVLTTLRPLSRILAHAARRGAIPVNPCSQLERGERPRLDDQRPKRILTLQEMHALLDARGARSTAPPRRPDSRRRSRACTTSATATPAC